MKKSFYLLGAYLIVLTLSSCKSGKSTEVIDKGKNVDKVEIVAKSNPKYSTFIQDESGSRTYTFTSDMSKDEFLKEMFFNHVDVNQRGGGDPFFGYLTFANYWYSDVDTYTKYHGSYFSDEKHIGNNILNFEADDENERFNLKSKDDYNYSYKEKINFNSCSYSNGDDVYSLLEYGNVEMKSLGTYPSNPKNGEGEQCDYSFDYSCYRKEYGMLNKAETALYWIKYSRNPEMYKDYLNLESGSEFYGKNTDNFNGVSSDGDEYTYAEKYFHPGDFSLTYRDDYINPTSIESSLSEDDPYYIRKESEDGSYVELCGSRPMCMDASLRSDIYAGITNYKLNYVLATDHPLFQPLSYQDKIAQISLRHFYPPFSFSDGVKSIFDAAYKYMDLSYELTDKYIIVDIKNYFYQNLYTLVDYYLEADSNYFIRHSDFAQSIISQIKSAKEKDNLYEHVKYYINYKSMYNELVEYDDISYEITSNPIIDYVLYEDNLKRDASGTYDDDYISRYEWYENKGYDLSKLREHYSEEYTDCTYSNCRIEIVSDSIDADFYNSKADSIKQEVKEGCAGYKNLS